MRVHFICRGNAFRSLMAETYLNSLQLKDVWAVSSGTVAAASLEKNKPNIARNLAVLERNDLGAYAKRSSHQLTQDRVLDDDLVVCMNQRAYDEAKNLVRLPKGTLVWDIMDINEEDDPPTNEEERIAHAEGNLIKIQKRVDELVESI